MKMSFWAWLGHSGRYFVRLLGLLALIYAVLYFFGGSAVSSQQFLYDLFFSTRGKFLFVALAVISLIYPAYGYVSREVKADIVADREKIFEAFSKSYYSLYRELPDGTMIFRASSFLRRIARAGDDRITVSPREKASESGKNVVVVEGLRRDTSLALYGLEGLLMHSGREDEE
jgi:hypothetical protein